MGIHEDRPASSEPVHVRGFCLGVTVVDAYPVVQIVDCYKQYIQRLGCLGMRFPGEEKRKDGNCDCLNGSDCSPVIQIYFFLRGAGTKGMTVLLISDSH